MREEKDDSRVFTIDLRRGKKKVIVRSNRSRAVWI